MKNIEEAALTNLRMLGIDQIANANTGHPGMVLSAAPLMQSVYLKNLKANPNDPAWINRDRFVLSAGHGSALLYAMLHLAGYDLPIEELKRFRKINSKTPGHPEVNVTPGVDASTGPLGQGFAMGVGMALAESHLRAKYNRPGFNIFDHYTYVICGDADFEEGVCQEAIQLAGVWHLNKLIVLYDSNDCQLDTKLKSVQSENFAQRMNAANWNYILVENGNSLDDIDCAIKQAHKADRPTLIEVKTIIGYGHPDQGEPKMHGEPFSAEDMKRIHEFYDWNKDTFFVSSQVKALYRIQLFEKNKAIYEQWNKMILAYKKEYPREYDMIFDKRIICFDEFNSLLHNELQATRSSSSLVMQRMQELDYTFFGGSADLTAATKIKGFDGDYEIDNQKGNNVHFGVREFAMGAITNGICLHKGLRAFSSTFLVFSDYMKNAIRMAALQKLPNIFILTHDSIAAGFDGPTHQPIEQLIGLRATPNLNVIRPADMKETIGAYFAAYNSQTTPTAIILCRQNVPQYINSCWKQTQRGAYVLREATDVNKKLDAIIIATGSEVAYAMASYEILTKKGYNLRIVSMPSMELFEIQNKAYRDSVITPQVPVVTIEASSAFGWYKYAGIDGLVISANSFGSSGFGDDVLRQQGFDDDAIARKIDEFLKAKK